MMTDDTNPPTNPTRPIHVEPEPASNVVQLQTQPTRHEVVYVCGERRECCVCIENHTDETDPLHICVECGDTW